MMLLIESCRIALMATADAEGQVIDPAPLNTWAYIENEALKVSRNCLGKKVGGGFVFIAGTTMIPAKDCETRLNLC